MPDKRADLTVISLSGSAYLPWEEPAAAVVYGGEPGRIVATLVGGVCRYEKSDVEKSEEAKGGFEWHELIADASRARSRLLREAAPDVRPTTAAH